MKIKTDFVTNSSSTGFIITNKSDKILTIVDFVAENPQLVEEFVSIYNYVDPSRYTQKALLISAACLDLEFKPHEEKECVFGDEQGTVIGEVFDYILRDGGESKNFKWRFKEYYR